MAARLKIARVSYKFALSVTLVIGLLVAIGALALSTVTTMRDATNELDERRLVNAVSAAMSSVKKRLAGTVHDNAVWDDAYEAVRSGDPVAWIEDNWGTVSTDYPLYDGVIVLGPDGRQIAAYRKGQPIDAAALFGPGIVKRALVASRLENMRTVFDLYQIDGSIVVTATLGIRPVNDPDLDTAHTTLTFFKTLTPGFVGAIAEEFQINALRIQGSPDPGQTWRLITNFEGEPLGYFVWPKTDPGTAVYNTALPTLTALGGLLLALILIVITAFRFELKKESDLAVKAIHDATHDHLTGLYNRAGMIAAIDRAPAGSIFHLIDLDGFKGVNDVWGHATGDRLLRAIAETLTKTTPEAFAIGRFGGDEFALLHAGERDPSQIGNTIVHVLAQPFLIDGHHVEIGASIGYAGVVEGHDALETVHRADLALYCAKDGGRGQVQSYTAELDAQRKSLFALEEKLRTAIDSDEIHVVFQPLVCTRSGRTKGVEALARWSPATGPVSPCVFIPLAEKAGLIERLSMNVLEAALTSLAELPELDLSVNISPVQLANPRFAFEIEKVLEKHSFSASRLILEVTEGALISHPERACRSMTALRAKGVRFAMDDFGSGHASIGTLRQFAFDKVKIDRSLIASDEHAVVRATIDLANALGIPVTAEGIETVEQAAFARDAGCELLQGYLLGRPMAFPALVEHLTGATDKARSA